ncbi:unnamed protein product [Ceratitis capitata]|uniref:(Mediterranean fruit fly) hypothetical protein n=1 Tax=Ceratitis capitata TaxID=7213 RepID=A0A811UCR3_CERCA|nr:unnamed protein product [Ceratitis capitata]
MASRPNEFNYQLPNLANNTESVHVNEVVKDHDGKEYDQKHRLLLAVQSDVKVRDRTKQQESLGNVPAPRNTDPESRKRLREGLRELLSKLHSSQSNSDFNFQPSVESSEAATTTFKPEDPLSKMSFTYPGILECDDIPQSESLLHSAFRTDIEEGKYPEPMNPANKSVFSVKQLIELRRKLLKSRRNRLQMLPPYRRYPQYPWQRNISPYNNFNLNYPYSNFDCNYFLNPVNEIGMPTIEYIWEDYDNVGDDVDEDVKERKKKRESSSASELNKEDHTETPQ